MSSFQVFIFVDTFTTAIASQLCVMNSQHRSKAGQSLKMIEMQARVLVAGGIGAWGLKPSLEAPGLF